MYVEIDVHEKGDHHAGYTHVVAESHNLDGLVVELAKNLEGCLRVAQFALADLAEGSRELHHPRILRNVLLMLDEIERRSQLEPESRGAEDQSNHAAALLWGRAFGVRIELTVRFAAVRARVQASGHILPEDHIVFKDVRNMLRALCGMTSVKESIGG